MIVKFNLPIKIAMHCLKILNGVTKPAPSANQKTSFFTIYETESSLELHCGLAEYPSFQIHCTCILYETALKIANMAAKAKNMPLKNYVLTHAEASRNESACEPTITLALAKVS